MKYRYESGAIAATILVIAKLQGSIALAVLRTLELREAFQRFSEQESSHYIDMNPDLVLNPVEQSYTFYMPCLWKEVKSLQLLEFISPLSRLSYIVGVLGPTC